MARRKSWRNFFSGELVQKYEDAIDYLDENYSFFLTHVLNLGEPRYTNAIPTAAVALPDAGSRPEDFEFLFNEDFLDKLSVQDTAFILAHETLHIILNHLVLSRSFVDRKLVDSLMKKKSDTKTLSMDEAKALALEHTHAAIFNIAADCVINDYLRGNGLDPSDEVGPQLMWGQDKVNHNCANSTVTEVFDELMQQVEDFLKQNQCQTCGGTGQVGGQDNDPSEGQEEGEGGSGSPQDHQHGQDGQPCPDCRGTGQKPAQPGQGRGGIPVYVPFDSHDWMHEKAKAEDIKNLEDLWDQIKDEMPQEIEDMRDDINFQSGMKMAGDEAGAINQFAVEKGVSLEWVALLKEIDPDLFRGKGPIGPPPKASWHARPRKTAGMKNVVLPVRRPDIRDPREDKVGNKRPSIVMALDTSGSISRQDAARFIALAQSVPQDKMHMFTITFTTEYNVLDLDNPRYGSGGTSFSAIERYIQREVVPELGHYPKAVVVITDGYASFDNEKIPQGEQDSWFWLLTEKGGLGYYNSASTIGQMKMLDDFVDRNKY